MNSSIPRSHLEVLRRQDEQVDRAIASGEYEPFIYPWALISAFILIFYLMVPWRKYGLRFMRYPLFGAIVYVSMYCTSFCRSKSKAVDYGIGLISIYSVQWAASLMVLNDVQADFKRIEERLEDHEGANGHLHVESKDNAPASNAASNEKLTDQSSLTPELTQRKPAKVTPQKEQDVAVDQTIGAIPTKSPTRERAYYWQKYPSSISRRIGWVFDLASNPRCIGWAHQLSPIPTAPELASISGARPSKNYNYLTRRRLLQHNLLIFISTYLAIDVITVFGLKDPYFWGYISCPPPTHLPRLIQHSPVLLKSYRLLLTCTGVYAALQMVFSLSPLFYCWFLGPRYLGLRGEPFMYPNHYGSFIAVLDHGLAGWWGSWWHQTFRYAFQANADFVLRSLNISRKSSLGKAVQLFVSFTLSGSIHAAGSYTQFPPSHPIKGPFSFFICQPFGIIFQEFTAKELKRLLPPSLYPPKTIRRIANFLFVMVFLYWTAPLLCDDFARGGLWLYEPLPVSPMRAMGYGVEGEKWYATRNTATLYKADRWWKSGLAL